jgi:phosphopantetheinyl transferase (holo-ACP synthase)
MQHDNSCTGAITLRIATPEAARFFDPADLSDADRHRLSRLRRPLHRQEFVVSRALKQRYRSTDDGPVSLSHSGGLAALAQGPLGSRIGVDLELHRPRRDMSIARFAYSAAESEWLARETDERESLFYTLWVAKEAAAKALGISLIEALRNCQLLRRDGVWHATLPTALPWNLTVLRPRQDLSLAVALIDHRESALSIQTSEWPPERYVDWPVIAQLTGNVERPLDSRQVD